PKAVLNRAGAVLEALEERARGLEPLSEELPLLSRAAAACGPPASAAADVPSSELHPALAALAGLDLDALSPRDAQETLYRLRSMLDDAVFAPQHTLSSPG
ncbi:MAG: DNA mismatch repair protein MutS, partial [Acetobacteraceae bacterium]|nr:DNA mismatch repair protein MutS [Acetobacteraceae bacterium]